ncbi:metallophosphoesterase family protein [Meiothermus granaticius]|uniref:Phosphodiesterase n=1 Tax=Meiothermus granaticius NBRC 107808 TaxID=1227551 RepID=A0A399F7G7_9DEIN|nr:metallophosphoesterase [Meiothermus granaticius]RIH92033.1 phosphodiesterase [Meiothermus granaticius NBRC 107808]GEM86895.1 metallophosphoesterase [Meiothermus granaticius NBRC 107808]
MRIAILSDIHANLPALEAVLSDMRRVEPDLVVFNGDFINRGPSNRAVLERLWGFAAEHGKVWFTLGNHDDLVLKWARHDPSLSELYQDPLFAPAGWAATQLEPAHLDWLDTLPFQVAVEERGGVVGLERAEGLGQPAYLRITHGSPRHYREGYDDHQSLEVLGEIAQDYPAQVLVGSHTHRPFLYPLEGSLFLNSGAVGAPFNGDTRAQYLVLEIAGTQIQTEFRQVPYDLTSALRQFQTSGLLEECGLGAQIFQLETRLARSLLTPFWIWANRQGLPRDEESWRLFQQAFPERFVGTG